jgi:hypothetical protein
MDTNDTHDNVPGTGTPRFAELAQLVASMQDDFEKFYGSGNKAAGTRVRAAMQNLKAFAQTVRAEVLELRGGKPAAAGGPVEAQAD